MTDLLNDSQPGDTQVAPSRSFLDYSHRDARELQNQATRLKIAQEQHQNSAMDELSQYTEKFIAGPQAQGSDAGMPEQLGGPRDAGEEMPGLEKAGPQDAQHRLGFNLYQNTNLLRNPEYLNGAAQIFMRHRMPQGVQWLENSYKASKENLIDATQLAVAGDLPGAEKAYNSTGDHKVVPGSLKWADEKKTTLTGVNQSDGQSFEVKPQELLKSFLSPKDYFEQTSKAEERKSKANLEEAQAEYYRGAKSALDRAKADKLGKINEKDLNNTVAKGGLALRKQIEAEQAKEDAKFNVNGMISLLPDMQKDLGQAIRDETDPEVALSTVYNTYRDRVSGLNTALTQITTAANKPWTDAGKNDAMKTGLQDLIDQHGMTASDIKRYLPATKVNRTDQERITKVLGALAVTGKVNSQPAAGKVEEPKTTAEFDALKSGTRFKNPADGKTYTKK